MEFLNIFHAMLDGGFKVIIQRGFGSLKFFRRCLQVFHIRAIEFFRTVNQCRIPARLHIFNDRFYDFHDIINIGL